MICIYNDVSAENLGLRHPGVIKILFYLKQYKSPFRSIEQNIYTAWFYEKKRIQVHYWDLQRYNQSGKSVEDQRKILFYL